MKSQESKITENELGYEEILLSDGNKIFVKQLTEEDDFYTTDQQFLRARGDQQIYPFLNLIIKGNQDRRLLKLILTHPNHFYLKNEDGSITDKDKNSPLISFVVNKQYKESIIKNINSEQELNKIRLKRRISPVYEKMYIEFIQRCLVANIFVFSKTYHNNRTFQQIINSKGISLKSIEKTLNQDFIDKLEKENVEALEEYISFDQLINKDPILIRDILLYMGDVTALQLVDHNENLCKAMGIQDLEFEEIIGMYEKVGMIEPFITFTYCATNNCLHKSISFGKNNIDKCPNCLQANVMTIIVYSFNRPLSDFMFKSVNTVLSFYISTYLKEFYDKSKSVYCEQLVRNSNNEALNQVDVLLINEKKEAILIECEIYQQVAGEYDKIRSKIEDKFKKIIPKLESLNISKSYFVNNLRTEKETVNNIVKNIKTLGRTIEVIKEDDINEFLSDLI